jgi:hypothetical protein
VISGARDEVVIGVSARWAVPRPSDQISNLVTSVVDRGCAGLVRASELTPGRMELVEPKTGCRATQLRGIYPPLPRWSGAVTWGVYRGSGPPLPAGVRAASGSGGPGAERGRPSPSTYHPPCPVVGGGGRVAPGGMAASRSARRYPARLTPSTLTCRPERWTPACSSSSARRSGVNSA